MKSKHRYFPWLREFYQTQPHSHSLPPLTPSTLPGFSVLHLRHGPLPGFCHFACLPQTKCLSSADFGFLCRLLSLTCLYLHLLRPGHPLRNQAPGPGLQPSQGTAPGERGWVSGSTGSSPVGASAVSTVCSRVQWPCRAQCVQLSCLGTRVSECETPRGTDPMPCFCQESGWKNITCYPWGLTAHICMSEARRHSMTKRTVQFKGLSQHS